MGGPGRSQDRHPGWAIRRWKGQGMNGVKWG